MKNKDKSRKVQTSDFSFNDLPMNRFRQFFDIFKIEWRNLIKLGLLTLLFLTPFLVFYFLMLFFASSSNEVNPIIIINNRLISIVHFIF